MSDFDEYSPELTAHAERIDQAAHQRVTGPSRLRFDPSEWFARQGVEPASNAREERARAARDRTRAQRLSEAHGRLDRWMQGANVPRRYRELEWREELVPGALRTWAATFPRAAGGAILAGTYGRGKTCAAVWLMRELYLRSIGPDPEWGHVGPAAKMVACADLYDLVFAKATAALVSLRSTPLLVIDDLGVGYEHDWPLAAMDRLVDVRYGDMLPTVVTSNLYPTRELARANGRPDTDSFEGRYPRAYSRLRDPGGPGLVLMVGDDMRRPAHVRSVR